MLELLAESLLLASRLTATDPRNRAALLRRREDEEWLTERRKGLKNARTR